MTPNPPWRAASALVIAALAGAAAADAPMRVVSFNLYHGGVTSVRWGDGDLIERRLTMVATQLQQIGADVVGVQELSLIHI